MTQMLNKPLALSKAYHMKAFSTGEGVKIQASNLNSLFQSIKGDRGDTDPNDMLESPLLIKQPQTKLLPAYLKVLKHQEEFKVAFDEILILDLDETLLHSHKEYPGVPSIVTPLKVREIIQLYYVIKRPGADEFLGELTKYYNICVYTSSEEEYATGIIEATGIKKFLYGVYSRKHCYKVSENIYVKNLERLGFPEDCTVLIDDFPLQMKHQPKNGIIIKRFFNDSQDKELSRLVPFLVHLSKLDKVTPVAKHMFEFFAEESQMRLESIRLPLLDADSRGSLDGDNQETCDSFKNQFEMRLMMAQSADKKHFNLAASVSLSKTIKTALNSKRDKDSSINEKNLSLTTRPASTTGKPSLQKLSPKEI